MTSETVQANKAFPAGVLVHLNGIPCRFTRAVEVQLDVTRNSAAAVEWDRMVSGATGTKAPDPSSEKGLALLMAQTADQTRKAVIEELRTAGVIPPATAAPDVAGDAPVEGESEAGEGKKPKFGGHTGSRRGS